MKRKLISIIIPIFNEAGNVPLIYRALKEVMGKLPTYDHELIFVDDGSVDDSAARIAALGSLDERVVVLEFTRNFGKEMATTAGLRAARGAAAIMIDADLQHPPALIPKFIEYWERGAELVVGVRTKNGGEGPLKRMGAWFFYSIMKAISDAQLEQAETDFRLLDRTVIDALNGLTEHRRMTRALINWLGFKKEKIDFEAPARTVGETKYSPIKLVRLALYSFISYSLLPLRIAGYLGLVTTFAAGALGVMVFFEHYVFLDPFSLHISGSAQLAIITVFLGGIILMCLGVIALYIENIHSETAGRPLYVVRRNSNVAPKRGATGRHVGGKRRISGIKK
jgi:dolichol-phosphate mannosyltransferase